MRIGLQLGYWGAAPPADAPELIRVAGECGFTAISSAESWGSDAFTPLAWWGSLAPAARLVTSVAQVSARTPAATAMHALTLDHLSGGRFTLGLGVSGPQVVEGWYGQPFAQPLARTREYVRIVRDVLARSGPVTAAGPHHPLPYQGPGSTGLGKPLKSITHPLRADVPIWLGAEGPRNVALAGEIADGWICVFHSLRAAGIYEEWLGEGLARRASGSAPRTREDFEVVANCQIVVTDDRAGVIELLKPMAAHYVGGMGAPELNFHANLYRRMGFGVAVDEIVDRFQSGDRAGAVAAVPDEMVDEISIIGDEAFVRAELGRREAAGVSMILTGVHGADQIRAIAAAAGLRPLPTD